MEIFHHAERSTALDLAAYIDHTILTPTTVSADVERICLEAVEYGFVAVCVPPLFVEQAARLLKNASTQVATVVGFPLGYSDVKAKVAETRLALKQGADEIDMVIQIGSLLEGKHKNVQEDIAAQKKLCAEGNALLKVIIETSLLDRSQIEKVCEICAALQVDFVKTSTGFNGKGAEVDTVAFMRSVLPASIQIKASGGIRDRETALKMIQAGATRIGASAGIKIVSE